MFGLEDATWPALSDDLRGWLSHEAGHTARGVPTPCRVCDRLAEDERRDYVAMRDVDWQMVRFAHTLSLMPPRTNGRVSPVLLHPEGPGFARRQALSALAWRLTQVATAVGAGLPTPPPQAPWVPKTIGPLLAEFREDMADDAHRLLRREIAETLHGHCEVFVSLPFLSPTALRRRRQFSKGCYGPLKSLWWPYRYPGGMAREVLLEGAVWLILLGAAGLVSALVVLPALTAPWVRVGTACLLVILAGVASVASLAGGVETWGDEIGTPFDI